MESYQKILSEAAALSDIIDAIDNHLVIRFYYKGDETENAGERLGEVYALGESTAGNKLVRIYQLRGATDSVIPEWKTFRLDKMDNLEAVRTFSRARPNYNPKDDKTMSRVFNIAEF